MSPTKLVIFDFDGTLFDTHRSISHCIRQTFATLLPPSSSPPPEAEIQRLISSGAGLQDTFKTLFQQLEQPVIEHSGVFDEDDRRTRTYRALYATEGQALVRPFEGAGELLAALRARGIPAAVVSNKGVAAVAASLANAGLADAVPPDLLVGDTTPGAARKPDPGSYVNVLVPALKARRKRRQQDGSDDGDGDGGDKGEDDDLGPGEVLVVGDTAADIRFARNIGARACWCRYGYGDKEECSRLKPDYVVDSLGDVVQAFNVES